MHGRRSTFETHAKLEQELGRERCAALARITARLEDALHRLTEALAVLRSLPADARAEHIERCRALRAEVRLCRWYLEVQRESVGLRRHQILDELYPLPESTDA